MPHPLTRPGRKLLWLVIPEICPPGEGMVFQIDMLCRAVLIAL
jgi:hypothetical protein